MKLDLYYYVIVHSHLWSNGKPFVYINKNVCGLNLIETNLLDFGGWSNGFTILARFTLVISTEIV